MMCLVFLVSACHAPPKKEMAEESHEVAAPKQAPVTTSLINESGQKIGNIEVREIFSKWSGSTRKSKRVTARSSWLPYSRDRCM